MRNLTIQFATALVVLASILVGCPAPEPVEFQVEPLSIQIPIGTEFALSISSTDPRDKTVKVTPENPLVARVDSGGVVHGLGLGKTDVTVIARHSGESATVEVTVVPPADFNRGLPPNPAQFEPTMERSATDTHVECTLHFPGVAATIERDMQTLYHRIHLMGAGQTQAPGKPELPAYTLHVAIPRDSQTGELANWSVTVSPELKQSYEDILVYPAQPPAWIENAKANYHRPAFVRDDTAYQASTRYPGWDYQSDAFQLGNLDVLEIRVFPVQYIPAEKRLILARRLRVQVGFTGVTSPVLPFILGDFKGIQERGAEEWLANEMLNGDRIPAATASDLTRALAPVDTILIHDEAFELLVVTRPDLYGQAHRLARWRQDTGTRVYLASLGESTYPDAESIRDFIVAQDDSNRLPLYVTPGAHAMSAILIFGDAELIPPHQGMNYRGEPDPVGINSVLTVGTDYPYATIRGDDDVADVAIGRISVDNLDEAEAVVDKIIQYESRTPGDHPNHAATYGYFDDVIQFVAWLETRLDFTRDSPVVHGVGAGFIGNVLPGDYLGAITSPVEGPPLYRVQEVTSDTELLLTRPYEEEPTAGGDYGGVGRQDGQDDWEFFVGAERIRAFLTDRGATVRFGYNRNGGADPIADFYGDDLPPEILAYAWDAGPEDIQANWRQGRDGIIVHCDHGLRAGWQHPSFETRNPSATNPGHMIPMDDPATAYYPIVFSMNCDSGWFDNETDTLKFSFGLFPLSSTGPRQESFCERILRYPNGGAVAAVGAIRGSDADANDRLLDGLFAALYADYAEGSISPWRVRPEFDRLGPAFRWAMFHQKTWLGDDTVRVQYNQEIYHLHGDPMLHVNLPTP